MRVSPATRRWLGCWMGFAFAVVALSASVASASPDAQTRPAASNTLTIGFDTAPGLLDPGQTGGTTAEWGMVRLAYDLLVTMDGGSPQPDLATSWKVLNPTTYVFQLRHGVRFANGRLLTSADVVGTFDRLIADKTLSWWAPQLPIQSIRTPGKYTVRFNLSKPYPAFLAALANATAAILPMQEVDAGTYDPTKQMAGTGPYQMKSFTPGQEAVFARNPYYWRKGYPKTPNLLLKFISDDATRVAQLRTGAIQLGVFGNPDAFGLLRPVPNVKVIVQHSSDFYRLNLNATNPKSPFADVRVRQAFAYSLDRSRIQRLALNGTGTPVAFTPTGLPGSLSAGAVNKLPTYKRDVAKAKNLLAAAGTSAPTIDFVVPASGDNPTLLPIAQIIQQNAAQAGFNVRIIPHDYATWHSITYGTPPLNFDLTMTWYAGYGDPIMAGLNVLNAERYGWFDQQNASVVNLINRIAATPISPLRTKLIADLDKAVANSANVVPLFSHDVLVATRRDLVTAKISSYSPYDIYFWNVATYQTK